MICILVGVFYLWLQNIRRQECRAWLPCVSPLLLLLSRSWHWQQQSAKEAHGEMETIKQGVTLSSHCHYLTIYPLSPPAPISPLVWTWLRVGGVSGQAGQAGSSVASSWGVQDQDMLWPPQPASCCHQPPTQQLADPDNSVAISNTLPVLCHRSSSCLDIL